MYAVILAGGGGTRLWPLSRSQRPKPFLPLLDGGRCLLQATVERLSPLVEPEDVYVVTDVRYRDLVREVVPALPPANIIAEPMGRNTAAAVAMAGHAIERPADDVMISLHADQSIADEAGFRAVLAAAVERASGGDIVTLGIEPTEPSTGFGYILATGQPTSYAGCETWRVERFEEKPSPERAQELIDGRRAYWNAGAFIWRGESQWNTQASVATVVINVALCLVWIPRAGIVGAAWASTAAYALGSAIMLLRFQRTTGLSWGEILIPRRDDWRR